MATNAGRRTRPTVRATPLGSTKGADLRGTQYVLRAIANPFRQRILAVMYAERGPLTFTEVAKRLGVSDDSSVSFHLNRLTGPMLVSNYVRKTPEGIRSIYEITDEGVAWMKKLGLSTREAMEVLLEPRDESAPRSW